MANELTREHLTQLARLGAERRLEELREEEASIRAAFPDLSRGPVRRASGASGGATASTSQDAATPARRTRKRRRGGMTDEGRQAVSERMKRYWAERRKAKRG